MRFRISRHYLKKSGYAVGVIVVSGALLFLVWNVPIVMTFLDNLFAILSPIITGLALAYVMNPICEFFEHSVFRFWQNKTETRQQKKRIHSISVTITIILVLVILSGFVSIIIPQLVTSILKITESFDHIPVLVNDIIKNINNLFGSNTIVAEFLSDPIEKIGEFLNNLWNTVKDDLIPILSNMGTSVLGAVNNVLNIIVAFVIGINCLAAKNMLMMQTRKIMFALFPKRFCRRSLDILGRANKIFRLYIRGVVLDAFLVGCLCGIGCALMGISSALLIGLIIGLCNFIPFFGPFIGAVPTTLIILMEDPIKAIWFIVFLIVLQQFDGNVMSPAIQGDVIGLPSVWILAAIMVGGGAFGFIGMLIAVPTFAVFYMLLKDFVERRLRSKTLPTDSYSYEWRSSYLLLANDPEGAERARQEEQEAQKQKKTHQILKDRIKAHWAKKREEKKDKQR